jgi:acyl carrier protein
MQSVDLLIAVLADAGRELPAEIGCTTRLREDLGLDSLELAVLAVQIEAKFGVDVFANRVCRTVGDIESQFPDA